MFSRFENVGIKKACQRQAFTFGQDFRFFMESQKQFNYIKTMI